MNCAGVYSDVFVFQHCRYKRRLEEMFEEEEEERSRKRARIAKVCLSRI